MSRKNIDEKVVNEAVENTVPEQATEEKAVYGVVTLGPKFKELNIRDKASKAGKVVATVKPKTKLTINETKSTNGWYAVITKEGVEGFCMKEFITIK